MTHSDYVDDARSDAPSFADRLRQLADEIEADEQMRWHRPPPPRPRYAISVYAMRDNFQNRFALARITMRPGEVTRMNFPGTNMPPGVFPEEVAMIELSLDPA
jgi:hypothetical protein